MSACVSKSFHLSSPPLKIDEDNNIEKQGIITILGSDSQSSKAAASLRRTLSADMSSNNWLTQNGFNPIKKVASFAQLCTANNNSSTDEEVKGKGQDEIWASIQSEKNERNSMTWGSIMVEDKEGSTNLPPPYIHPLVKRTTSSLSEKSLQICTESLGTETGSDVFSSDPTSENDDQEDEKVKINVQESTQQQQQKDAFEEVHVVKYNYSCTKKMATKSFPPPLPSLAKQDGASLQMQSHRQNGRLVLEAVSIPTKNCFLAQREHGRLLLTLVDNSSSSHDDDHVSAEEIQEIDQVFKGTNDEVLDQMMFEGIDDEVDITKDDSESDDDEGFEEEEENEGFFIDQRTKIPSGVITMPKGAFMMNKFMGLHNKNLTWSPKLINNGHNVKLLEVEEDEMVVKNGLTPLPQSLPPPPRVARLISSGAPPTANSFNAYEYFWKEKPTLTNIITPVRNDYNPNDIKNNHNNKVIMKSNLMGYEQQNLVLMKGDKGDYLVPFLSRCTEPRRSLLFWDSYCIATT